MLTDYKRNKGKRILVGVVVSFLTPIWVYLIATNLLWPDLHWGVREWHQILGTGMFFATLTSVTILGVLYE